MDSITKSVFRWLAFGPLVAVMLSLIGYSLAEMLMRYEDRLAVGRLAILVILLAIPLQLVNMAMYISHLLRNPSLSSRKQGVWIAAIVVTYGLATMLYFGRFMGNQDAEPEQQGESQNLE